MQPGRLVGLMRGVCCAAPIQSSRMTKRFHMYWLRESGCDLGTPLDADELDAAIRARVMELAGGDDRTLDLYLPFLDGREARRPGEALRSVTLGRGGDRTPGGPWATARR